MLAITGVSGIYIVGLPAAQWCAPKVTVGSHADGPAQAVGEADVKWLKLQTQSFPVKIVGQADSPAAYVLRDFLGRSDVPFEWVEVDTDERARTSAGVDSSTTSGYRSVSSRWRFEAGLPHHPASLVLAGSTTIAVRLRSGDLWSVVPAGLSGGMRSGRSSNGCRGTLCGGRPGGKQFAH